MYSDLIALLLRTFERKPTNPSFLGLPFLFVLYMASVVVFIQCMSFISEFLFMIPLFPSFSDLKLLDE